MLFKITIITYAMTRAIIQFQLGAPTEAFYPRRTTKSTIQSSARPLVQTFSPVTVNEKLTMKPLGDSASC